MSEKEKFAKETIATAIDIYQSYDLLPNLIRQTILRDTHEALGVGPSRRATKSAGM